VSRPVFGRLPVAAGAVLGVAAVPEVPAAGAPEPEDDPVAVCGLGESGLMLPLGLVCVPEPLDPEEPEEPEPEPDDPDPEFPNGSWYC
jgi:hypothetical protein